MATVTRNPTANQTPDAGQGGTAVSGATNTGHSATNAVSNNGDAGQNKTCRWSVFQALGAIPSTLTLKVDYSVNGSVVSVVGASNQLTIDYTINGGGAWNSLVFELDVVAPGSATGSVALSPTQTISNVQVRDAISAATSDVGDSASITVTVSAVRLEAVFAEANRIIIMGM